MFNRRLLASALFIGLLGGLYLFGQDCAACNTVLAGGVFNSENIAVSDDSRSAFHDWMCVSEFKDHDEAHSAGINFGIPVYGVPISVGGKWADNTREEWKKTQCSDAQRQSSRLYTFTRALRTASPDILTAWTSCISVACPRAATTRIACSTTPQRDVTLFKSSWTKGTGEAEGAAPKVTFFAAYDATCDRVWKKGDVLKVAETTFRCTPTVPLRDAVFVLETTGGSCSPTGSAARELETISGKVVLSAERHIRADKIVLTNGSEILTNGHKLVLEATEIEAKGTPKISSFEKVENRPANQPGRSAGAVIIKASRVTGTSVVIDNRGEDGTPGSSGTPGSPGPPGHQGSQRQHDITGCHGGSNGTPGGQGGPGGDGLSGGRGGDGGAVIYSVTDGIIAGPVTRIDILTTKVSPTGAKLSCGGPCGGFGGAGGAAGPGGAGGAGGQGAPGTTWCGGTDPGPGGGGGQPGRAGADGADGAPGQIVRM